jgi:hypothetical protein
MNYEKLYKDSLDLSQEEEFIDYEDNLSEMKSMSIYDGSSSKKGGKWTLEEVF